MKRVMKDGQSSREHDGSGEEGATENPSAGLVGHADGLEAGSAPSSSSYGKPESGGPPGAGRELSQTHRPASAPAIPNYSEREEHVVRLSKRMLHFFYFCGTIFAAIILWQIITQHKEKHVIAWSIAAIFVGVAVPFSLHDIHMHTLHVCPSSYRVDDGHPMDCVSYLSFSLRVPHPLNPRST